MENFKLKYRSFVREKHPEIAHKLIDSDIETFAIDFAEYSQALQLHKTSVMKSATYLQTMEEIIKKLSFYGNIEVLKDEFVFTLLMTKKENGYNLTMQQIPFKILEIVTGYLGDKKPDIEVMKNEETFLLLVLKPKFAK